MTSNLLLSQAYLDEDRDDHVTQTTDSAIPVLPQHLSSCNNFLKIAVETDTKQL